MHRRGWMFGLRSQLLAGALLLSCAEACFAVTIGGGGGLRRQRWRRLNRERYKSRCTNAITA